MANEYENAARTLRDANDDLDSGAAREAHRVGADTADVNSHAQKVAERENWSGRR